MAVEEISKRFTLHDVFGYLLPGTVSLLGSGAFAIAYNLHASVVVTALSNKFQDLHISVQILAFVATAYVCGLLAIGIGDITYVLLGFRRRKPLGASTGKWALSDPVKAALRKKLNSVIPESTELSERDQRFLAYSHLIDAQKDGFVQLMSGRGAMYLGLTGAITLIAASGVALSVASNWPSIDYKTIIAIIFTMLVGELWTISNAYAFDCWWEKHVVFAYLSNPRPYPSAKDEKS
jgi:hypothetical protein